MLFALPQGIERSGKELAGQSGLSKSLFNLEEASVALRLMLLMGTDPTVQSIAIIVPYRAQVKAAKIPQDESQSA